MSTNAPPLRPLPVKPPLPPPVSKPALPAAKASGGWRLGKIKDHAAQRVLIYGTGGIGKTSLACLAATRLKQLAYFDLEQSLPKLKAKLKAWGVHDRILPVEGISNFPDLAGAIESDLCDDCDGIIVDSFTRVEEWAIAHTLRTVPASENKYVNRLELYGYGKGFSHVYETMLPIFNELNRHYLAGRTIILICHNITAEAAAVQTEKYLRWEPRLLHQLREKHSVRMKAKEWVDELAFIGYDVTVSDKGMAQGCGTRTIQVREQPYCMAKSRSLSEPIVFMEGDAAYWSKLFPETP